MSDQGTDMQNEKFAWGETSTEIEKLAIEVLKSMDALDVDHSLNGTNLLAEVRKTKPGINENTFRQTISFLAKSDLSIITKVDGKHGYYISETVERSHIEEEVGKAPEKRITKREYALYPVLSIWLRDQGYRVGREIFNRKINETWGNPDIAGVKIDEHLSKFELEIVTIEAKPSKDKWNNNWRIDIFEAISHRRFANRVYFAFAHKQGDKIPDLAEMKYYCELYNIGLLIIELSPVLFTRFETLDISEDGFSDEDFGLINVSERVPASFNRVPLSYQQSFCKKTLEINEMADLFAFGF